MDVSRTARRAAAGVAALATVAALVSGPPLRGRARGQAPPTPHQAASR